MTLQTTERTVDERLQRGIDLKNEGRYPEAEAEFRAVLADDPLLVRAHRELALVMNFTGRFEESIEELSTAVKLDPEYLEGRCDLALAYSMLGFNDEARAELEAVLEIDPAHPTALRHIGYFQ